jgi:hypothetical protein
MRDTGACWDVAGVVMPICCLLAVVDLNQWEAEAKRHLLDLATPDRAAYRAQPTILPPADPVKPAPGVPCGSPPGGRGDGAHRITTPIGSTGGGHLRDLPPGEDILSIRSLDRPSDRYGFRFLAAAGARRHREEDEHPPAWVLPRRVEDRSRLCRGGRFRVRPWDRRRLDLFDGADSDPTPAHGPHERAAEDGVHDPDAAGRKAFTVHIPEHRVPSFEATKEATPEIDRHMSDAQGGRPHQA